MEMPRAQSRGVLFRFSRQENSRFAARRVLHFNVPPPHAFPPTRSERLHHRFLRREARRIALMLRFVPLAVANLRFRENAFEKRLPMPPDRRRNAINLRNICAHPYDHFVISRGSSIIRWCMHAARIILAHQPFREI